MEQIRLGLLVATRGIEEEMQTTFGFREFCTHCLLRHRSQDWGDVPDEDKISNDWAVRHDARLLSAYSIPERFHTTEDKIWIITDADRSATTILFPDEY